MYSILILFSVWLSIISKSDTTLIIMVGGLILTEMMFGKEEDKRE